MKIVDCVQGTPEWHAARAGIPTASKFAVVLRKRGTTKGSASVERRRFIDILAGERITGQPASSYESADMIRGREMEPEARAAYAFINDVEPQLVGFATLDDGSAGCSPDSLIGSDGVLEIKTAAPHVLLEAMRGQFPAEHVAQCQGNLWILEREWIDLMLFWPRMKPKVFRARRDEAYIKDLALNVAMFNAEVEDVITWYERHGTPVKVALVESLKEEA